MFLQCTYLPQNQSPHFLLLRLWYHLNHIFNKWAIEGMIVFGRRIFIVYKDIVQIMDCKDVRETRLRNMKRRGSDSVTETNSIAIISDLTCSWISSCGWARGDSEHDRSTSQFTVSCRHDDVAGKVWRAVTTHSLSLGPQLNLYDRPSYRSDIEELCDSSPFSCLSIVAKLLTEPVRQTRAIFDDTYVGQYQTLYRFESLRLYV